MHFHKMSGTGWKGNMCGSVIHIYGASGSGTSTLGRYLAKELGYAFMDTDDYFWLPTNPKYTQKRERTERLAMMKSDLLQSEKVVISGSLVDWGDVLIPYFTLAVRVVTDEKIRINRLKEREKRNYGSRIEAGGDMHEAHLTFLSWAAAYDTGDVGMRSKAQHDEWQKRLICRQMTVNGEDPPANHLERIKAALRPCVES